MQLAPVVLFVYNRPWHTRQTLEALAKNDLADQSILYIYSDGPKSDANETDRNNINAVRSLIRERNWCKEVIITDSEFNKGLAKSVIDGVTEVIDKYGSVIVLEDDLVTSQGFLSYMNEALENYQDVQNVWSVTGYMFPIPIETEPKNVLLPYISTWGWATWKERWDSFNRTKHQFQNLIESEHVRSRFNLSDYDYSSMLKNNRNNSWGIKWYFHVFCHNGLSVFPSHSLLTNIGKDGSGTNYTTREKSKEPVLCRMISIRKDVQMDLPFLEKYLTFFSKKTSKRNFLKNVFLKTN